MKKLIYILAALALLLIPSHGGAQSGGEYTVIRSRSSAPATCSPSDGGIYWDTAAREFKECSAANTWTPVVPSLTLPQSFPAASHQWLNSYNASTGLFTSAQPDISDLTGTASDAQLANSYSGVGACGAHNWVSSLTRNAPPTCTQPSYKDLIDLPALQYQTVQADGTAQTQRGSLNFGSNFAVSDDAANDRSTVNLKSKITADLAGNADTASALKTTPAQCSGSQFATGIAANGNANCSVVSSSSLIGMLTPSPLTPPNTTGWTWDNQGPATVASNSGGALILQSPGTSGALSVLYAPTPATPWTLIAGFSIPRNYDGSRVFGGIALRESSTGKEILYGYDTSNNSIVAYKYTSGGIFSAAQFNYNVGSEPYLIWLKVHDDGTNITLYDAPDGQKWQQFDSHASNNWFSTDANGAGISVSGVIKTQIAYIHWSLTTP